MTESHTPPVLAAVVVPIRRRGAACEVFWARRADQLAFLGGFWAFIGGRVEDADGTDDPDAILRRAATREVAEEIGVAVAPARLMSAGRTVTPAWAPLRFDAAYYLAEIADDARLDVAASGGELVAGEWVRPEDAILGWVRGERLTTPVAIAVLDALAGGWDGAAERVAARLAATSQARIWDLAPGVGVGMFRTPTLPPAKHTNVYVIGGAEVIVIDPGSPYEDEQHVLEQELAQMAADGRRLRAVFLTHHHIDHASGAQALATRLGVPIAAHPITAQLLAGRATVTRLIEDGHVERLPGHGRIPERRVRAIFTPGHAPGHHVFLEETTGFMVAGDMVAGLGTILIDPPEGDMRLYLGSLARMRSLTPRAILPAHGPVLAAADAVLAHYAKHRLAREALVVTALGRVTAPVTPEELVPEVYADVAPALHGLAARSLLAHLEKLAAEGRATVSDGKFSARR